MQKPANKLPLSIERIEGGGKSINSKRELLWQDERAGR
jgi:hypothetical protein